MVLAALGFSVLVTPTLAQSRHRHYAPVYGATRSAPNEHYPNGALKSGSESNFESGAEFNVGG